jgi:hypothetical protein
LVIEGILHLRQQKLKQRELMQKVEKLEQYKEK